MPFRDEAEFVAWLRRRWPERGPGLDLGIGDDAAVVRARRGCDFVLTTDLSIEGIHFRLNLHPPRSVGHRALARALSDLAAMGARPRFALLSIALARPLTRRWLSAFYDGLGSLARRFHVTLIGGDTAIVDGATTIDVVAAGQVEHGRALRRGGATASDRIYVTGKLGRSALGLVLIESGERPCFSRSATGGGRAGLEHDALLAHLYPEPRCAAGLALARHRLASAAIDVSDGFAADLTRLCDASRCGAVIREAQLPLCGRSAEHDPLQLALYGGEDYELIFTAPAARAARLPRRIGGVRVHEIGQVQAARRLVLERADGSRIPLDSRGYDHFRQRAGSGRS